MIRLLYICVLVNKCMFNLMSFCPLVIEKVLNYDKTEITFFFFAQTISFLTARIYI